MFESSILQSQKQSSDLIWQVLTSNHIPTEMVVLNTFVFYFVM